MFFGIRPLIIMGVVFCMASEGLAQGITSDGAAKAYQFVGVTKYFTFPSKYLFGNEELLEFAIVDGYRASDDKEFHECFGEEGNMRYVIVQEERHTEWWRQTSYVEIENPDGKNENTFYLIYPPTDDCLTNLDLDAEKFLVDPEIARKLRTGEK